MSVRIGGAGLLSYTITASEPETGRERVLKGIAAGPGALETLDVRL